MSRGNGNNGLFLLFILFAGSMATGILDTSSVMPESITRFIGGGGGGGSGGGSDNATGTSEPTPTPSPEPTPIASTNITIIEFYFFAEGFAGVPNPYGYPGTIYDPYQWAVYLRGTNLGGQIVQMIANDRVITSEVVTHPIVTDPSLYGVPIVTSFASFGANSGEYWFRLQLSDGRLFETYRVMYQFW